MLQYHVAAARIAWQVGPGNTKRKSVTRESQLSIGNFRVVRSDTDHTTRLAPFTNGQNCQAFQKWKTIWNGCLLGNPKTDLTSLLSCLAFHLVIFYPTQDPPKHAGRFARDPNVYIPRRVPGGFSCVIHVHPSCFLLNIHRKPMKTCYEKRFSVPEALHHGWRQWEPVDFCGPEDQGQLPSIRWFWRRCPPQIRHKERKHVFKTCHKKKHTIVLKPWALAASTFENNDLMESDPLVVKTTIVSSWFGTPS